ncbi:MAG TPA: phage holin family protein [Terriglobia bacterium]|nr:phage holin family protein [Terriglobia bacterium]
MANLLLNWLLSTLALVIVTRIVPGFEITSFWSALLASVAVGIVNATIGLILKVITFPLTIVTLGLFWIVINALMLKLAAALVPGFQIVGFLPAFLGAIVLSIINLLFRVTRKALQDEPRSRPN